MKAMHMTALMVLAVAFVVSGTAFAAEKYCAIGDPTNCADCPLGGYDRTTVYEYQPASVYCPHFGQFVPRDPWTRCGAFCAAGQLPPGWPYGWGAEYWLRPNTNL